MRKSFSGVMCHIRGLCGVAWTVVFGGDVAYVQQSAERWIMNALQATYSLGGEGKSTFREIECACPLT